LWLALWGRLRGRRVVYDSHELFLETPMVLSRRSRRAFWSFWENAGFALIRRCVTVSPNILARLKARHPRVRFHLLPNMPGGEPEAIVPAPKDGPVRLVYQGGLRKASGLPELIAALRDRPGIRLDVYGGGSEAGFLREATRVSEISDRVSFHGVVPFEKLPALMAGAHAGIHLVQPTCDSFALTWSNKIFDYARAGVPVLFSDNPAHRALLEEFRVGVVADAFSPAAIGAALDRLLADRDGYAEACRAARERWRWETFFHGIPNMLEMLES
jgi:glycosyltransferase involved in cell wall biosynthesis